MSTSATTSRKDSGSAENASATTASSVGKGKIQISTGVRERILVDDADGLPHQGRECGGVRRPSAVAQQWNGEQRGGRKDGEYQPEPVPAVGGQARLWIHNGGTPHPHAVLRRAGERLANSGHTPEDAAPVK